MKRSELRDPETAENKHKKKENAIRLQRCRQQTMATRLWPYQTKEDSDQEVSEEVDSSQEKKQSIASIITSGFHRFDW